jgi:hypothetical protein
LRLGVVGGEEQDRSVRCAVSSFASGPPESIPNALVARDRMEDAVPMVSHRRRGLAAIWIRKRSIRLIMSLESFSARDLDNRATILCIFTLQEVAVNSRRADEQLRRDLAV